MAIVPVLAFAAFCVWLTVRIVNRQQRWAKWMLAAVLSLPALYVASFGPACRYLLPNGRFTEFYCPCVLAAMDGPRPVRHALWRWVNLCGGKQYLTVRWLFDPRRPSRMIQRSAGMVVPAEDFGP